MRRAHRFLAVLLPAVFLAGCSQPLQRTSVMTWEVPGQADDTLPLESGQIVMTSSIASLDIFATLLPVTYNPYIHAAVLSVEDGRPYVYEQYGRHWVNPFADSPTDMVTGRVKRVPLTEFMTRYDHIEIWDAGSYDKQTIVAFARRHFALKTPFDPYFDHSEQKAMYCTEFVALALEAGGAAPFEPVPNRENRSARVVLDWLKVPPELIQADSLIASGRRLATLSDNRTMTDIHVLDAVKQELYRRFTCDQKVGNLFRVSGPSVMLRPPVAEFLAAALELYAPADPAPDVATVQRDVSQLALRILGPYAARVACS